MLLKKIRTVVLLPAVTALAACATIMGNPSQTVPISSTPSDAKIVIVDETGVEMFKGTTPTSVTLQKSTGKYWGGKSYKVTISKDGYKDQTIPIISSANGWYVGGNLVFGGLIGWLIVDPLNGNMYTLSPEAVAATLSEGAAHNNQAKDGSIAILLLEDVPAAARNQMARIN